MTKLCNPLFLESVFCQKLEKQVLASSQTGKVTKHTRFHVALTLKLHNSYFLRPTRLQTFRELHRTGVTESNDCDREAVAGTKPFWNSKKQVTGRSPHEFWKAE